MLSTKFQYVFWVQILPSSIFFDDRSDPNNLDLSTNACYWEDIGFDHPTQILPWTLPSQSFELQQKFSRTYSLKDLSVSSRICESLSNIEKFITNEFIQTSIPGMNEIFRDSVNE